MAQEVLAYFLRNPRAADTLEGVTRWRLLEERIHRRVEEVDRALAWLVDEGFLLKRSTQGSDPIFSFNAAKASEAKSFVTDERAGRRRKKPGTP